MGISGLFPSYRWVKKSWNDLFFFLFLLSFFLFFFLLFFSSSHFSFIQSFSFQHHFLFCCFTLSFFLKPKCFNLNISSKIALHTRAGEAGDGGGGGGGYNKYTQLNNFVTSVFLRVATQCLLRLLPRDPQKTDGSTGHAARTCARSGCYLFSRQHDFPDRQVVRLQVWAHHRRERKRWVLRPQKPFRLIRDGEVGGSGIIYLTPTRYTVTIRMILHSGGQLCEPFKCFH